MSRKPAAKPRSGASARSVNYSTSPLLATPTPPWRSKLLVALVGLGFAVLIGRAGCARSAASSPARPRPPPIRAPARR